MVWDVFRIGEMRRREECFITLQSGHLLYYSKANNGHAGVGFLINRIWTDHSEGKQHQHQSSRTCSVHNKLKIVQVYAPTTSYSEEDINSFNNDVGETLGKPNHYTTVMGDFNAQIRKRTNPMETATDTIGFELRNERGGILVEWATSRKYKIMNTTFQKKAGRRWKSPNGATKTETDYLIYRLDIVKDVTVINQVNIGSEHRMPMSNIKLDVEIDRL